MCERSGWRNIEEAPRDGTAILVAVTGGGLEPVVGEAWWQVEGDRGDWWWANTSPGDYYASPIIDMLHGSPTHWMPLPEPPPPTPPDSPASQSAMSVKGET